MSSRYHFAEENPQSLFTEEDLVDDSTGTNPVIGLRTSMSLKKRFLQRLSKILAAELHIDEGHDGTSMDIFLSRDKKSAQPRLELDEELRKFVRSMEDALASIACYPQGPRHDGAREDLWDAILDYSYGNIDHVIHSLHRTFEDSHDVFADFITKMFGLGALDPDDSELDRELGDRVILLHQAVRGYNGSMRELNLLIHQASEMTRVLLHPQDRFKYLLGKARFANELYRLICTLGFSERVYSTLVRAAKTSEAFKSVTFHLRPLSPSKHVSFATLPPTSARSAKKTLSLPKPSPSPLKQETIRQDQLSVAAAKPQPQLQPASTSLAPVFQSAQPPPAVQNKPADPQPQPQPAPISDGGPLDALRPFLSEDDLCNGIIHISPTSKQDTALLISAILRGEILPVQSSAWYSLGFVTCKNKTTEQRLTDLYKAIIKEAQDPRAIFRELQTAVEKNQLVALFDTKEKSHFRKLFPQLEAFLNTPASLRWTVWRLRAFLQDADNTNPPPCLQRDYGFKLCRQHEEVLRLKDIYSRMLKKLGPSELHHACAHGRLYETAMREGIVVEAKNKRLMQNDYPSPFVGTDNNHGLGAYRVPLFKSQKGKL